MKKLVLTIVTTIVVISAVFTISATIGTVTDTKFTPLVQSGPSPLYIIKSFEKKIHVVNFSDNTLYYEIEGVTVKDLPSHDQNLLNNGICVYSNDELQSLIEDFES